MRNIIVTTAFGLAFGLWVGIATAFGQTAPKSLQEGGFDDIIKQRENYWTVGLAGGAFDGTAHLSRPAPSAGAEKKASEPPAILAG